VRAEWHNFFDFIPKIRLMNIWNRSSRIAEIYGAIIAAGLIVYFFIMYAVGLIHVIELRLLNLLIMLAGVYYAMKQFKRTHDGRLDYFRSMTTGLATAGIAAATFSLFLFIYLSLDKNLMQSIVHNEPLGRYMNPYIASFIVLLEGVFSGFMASYLLSNFMSTDTPVIDRATDNVSERFPEPKRV
jgi:hypothetical protein